MLLEHLDLYVGRQGAVRLWVGKQEWTVPHRTTDDADACTGAILGRSVYLTAGRHFSRAVHVR